MRFSDFRLMLAVPLLLIGGAAPCLADWQAAPAPSALPQELARYEGMIQNMSPGTLNLLSAQASGLLREYSSGRAPTASERQELKQYLPELQELKQNKGELMQLKAQLCSFITC